MGLGDESIRAVARVSVVGNAGVYAPEPTDDAVIESAYRGMGHGNGSTIDGMVEEALRLAGAGDGDGRGGPLLGNWIAPGQRVFILPNLVMHRRTDRGESTARFLAKCTNGAVVRPVLAHAVEAAGDRALVQLGSAPLQSCDYPTAASEAGFTGAGMVPTDLRGVATVWSKYGSLLEREERQVPTVEVDLGPHSFLDELYRMDASVDFRVGDYSPEETLAFHGPGRHIYTIHREVLESDVIVSVPKLKTHEKVGITCSLKGTVGTVTRKECLAHYRHGSGGDEQSHGNLLRSLASDLSDWSYSAPQTGLGNMTRILGKSAFRLARMGPHGIMGGAWSGNDTAWRMALDIARILRFARPDGSMATEPQRSHVVLVDGIVAGEGEGPLSPSPVAAGILVGSDDPVAADVACARLMGYVPGRIPLLAHAMDQAMEFPLRSWDACTVHWGERHLPGLDDTPSALGRPFRPPKGWVGSVERAPLDLARG